MPEDQSEDAILKTVHVEVAVRIGKAQPTMFEVSRIGPDTVLPLDTVLDDPVDLLVGTRKIAEGQLEEVETDQGKMIGVRVTKIADPSKIAS